MGMRTEVKYKRYAQVLLTYLEFQARLKDGRVTRRLARSRSGIAPLIPATSLVSWFEVSVLRSTA